MPLLLARLISEEQKQQQTLLQTLSLNSCSVPQPLSAYVGVFSLHSLNANVNPHASKHTNMGRVLAHFGKYHMPTSRICDTATGR